MTALCGSFVICTHIANSEVPHLLRSHSNFLAQILLLGKQKQLCKKKQERLYLILLFGNMADWWMPRVFVQMFVWREGRGIWNEFMQSHKCHKQAHNIQVVSKKKNTRGEQRASLKERHELFTPSDQRGNERDRKRDGDGRWVMQSKRHAVGLRRTVGDYMMLAVTMTETLWWFLKLVIIY